MRLPIVGGMLVLTVSASLTPANAGLGGPGNSDAAVTARAHMFGVSRCMVLENCCSIQCNKDAIRRSHTETRTSNSEKSPSCISTCVNAFEACFPRGGVRPNLSLPLGAGSTRQKGTFSGQNSRHGDIMALAYGSGILPFRVGSAINWQRWCNWRDCVR
jgi:hypothetical protein